MFLIFKSQEYGRQKLRATKLGAVYLKKVEDDAQEITEGTSHIYSWIRNQALSKTLTIVIFHLNHTIIIIIRVKPEGDDNDEDIVIRLDSKDPHKCKNITRFNYIKMDYIPVKLRSLKAIEYGLQQFPFSRETMIDHLEIESSIISRNSNEGKKQLERELEKGGSRQEEAGNNISFIV